MDDRQPVRPRLQPRAQIVLARVVLRHVAAEEGGLAAVLARARIAEQGAERGHHEEQAADDRGDRVARQPDHEHRPETPVHQGLSGAQSHPPEAELHAFRAERRLDEVVVADRGAAEGDEEIRSRRPGAAHGVPQGADIVGGDAEIDGLGAGLLTEGGEREAVRGDDLIPFGPLARPHQFVAGREHGQPRPAAHRQRGVAGAGGEREPARIEGLARSQEGVALPEVEPGPAQEPARGDRLAGGHGLAVGLGVLLDQDRVGAGRHGRAGEDTDRFAGTERPGEAVAGGAGADQAQACRDRSDVGGAHGVAVHGGGREGGLRAGGGKVGGQRPAGRTLHGHGLGLDGTGDRREDSGQRVGDGEEATQASASALQAPDLPPSFDSRRMPSMRIPRSAALTMS